MQFRRQAQRSREGEGATKIKQRTTRSTTTGRSRLTTSRSSARQKDAIALLKEDHQKVRGLFAAKAKVIKDRIEHHAEEEETEMFPKARKAIGARGLRELGAQMKARKEELKSDLGDSR